MTDVKRMVTTLVVLTLLFNLCFTQSAKADVLGDAGNLVAQLNPINLALGPLIDNAIAKGNQALADRLQQLQAILQEAIFSLNKMLKDRISQADTAAANRLDQLRRIANELLPELDSLIKGRIDQINDAMFERIQQMGNTTGNLVASLPIPTDPLPNVGRDGITFVRQPGQFTTLFVTGSGLFKENTKPEAYILKDNQQKTSIFSHAGNPVEVRSASMGLVELRINNSLFGNDLVSNVTLQLKMFRGGMLSRYAEPSIPLHVCSRLPVYSAVVTQTASGKYWEKRRVPYPSPVGRPDGVYIDDNGSHSNATVCASDFDGWEVDPDYPGGGLEVGSKGADTDGSNVFPNQPRVGCYSLYAGRDGSRGGNAWVGGVFIHQRQLQPTDQCELPQNVRMTALYGKPNTMSLEPSKAIGRCGASGVSATPLVKTHFAIVDSSGKTVDEVNLTVNARQSLLGGSVTVTEDEHGLIKFFVASSCQWNYSTQ